MSQSTTSRFDPRPDEAYGRCTTCGQEQPTEDDANRHMSQTHAEAALRGENVSHSVSVTNPGRRRRIDREVGSLLSSHLERFCEELYELVDEGDITAEEAAKAVSMYPDASDVWQQWYAEGGE